MWCCLNYHKLICDRRHLSHRVRLRVLRTRNVGFLCHFSVMWDWASAYGPQCSACSASRYATMIVLVVVTFVVKHVMVHVKVRVAQALGHFHRCAHTRVCECWVPRGLCVRVMCMYVVIVCAFWRCELRVWWLMGIRGTMNGHSSWCAIYYEKLSLIV